MIARWSGSSVAGLPPTVTFRDEAGTVRRLRSFGIRGVPDSITVRDLVRLRVREEVARYDATPTRRFPGLVRKSRYVV